MYLGAVLKYVPGSPRATMMPQINWGKLVLWSKD